MHPVSEEFLRALAGPIHPVVQVDVYQENRLLSEPGGIPVVAGSIDRRAGQPIRNTMTLTVTDAEGRWRPRATNGLSPYGTKLHVRMGLQLGQVVEYISAGWFYITSSNTDQTWVLRQASNGYTYQVTRGQSTQASASDILMRVSRDRFLTRIQPIEPTVFGEISRLLQGVAPWKPPTMTDKNIPASITYDSGDRLVTITELANVLSAVPVVTMNNEVTLAMKDPSGPVVWDMPVGEGGVILDMKESINSNELYNGSIARGTRADGTPLQSPLLALHTGPLRWNGPYGRVPHFYESSLLDTQELVNEAAGTNLTALLKNQRQTIIITGVWNPALELGDKIRIPVGQGWLEGYITSLSIPLTTAAMGLEVSVDPLELEALL